MKWLRIWMCRTLPATAAPNSLALFTITTSFCLRGGGDAAGAESESDSLARVDVAASGVIVRSGSAVDVLPVSASIRSGHEDQWDDIMIL